MDSSYTQDILYGTHAMERIHLTADGNVCLMLEIMHMWPNVLSNRLHQQLWFYTGFVALYMLYKSLSQASCQGFNAPLYTSITYSLTFTWKHWMKGNVTRLQVSQDIYIVNSKNSESKCNHSEGKGLAIDCVITLLMCFHYPAKVRHVKSIRNYVQLLKGCIVSRYKTEIAVWLITLVKSQRLQIYSSCKYKQSAAPCLFAHMQLMIGCFQCLRTWFKVNAYNNILKCILNIFIAF